MSNTFDVLLYRDLSRDLNEGDARKALAERFKLTEETVNKLLTAPQVTIKRALTLDQATQYQRIIESCGFKATVKNTAEPSTADDKQLSAKAADDIYQSPTSAVDKPVFCRQCGKPMSSSASACPECGQKVVGTGGPSKVTAGFLALFGGALGLHRFYLRQWWGIFYIPFGLLGVSFIVTWVEAIYFWVCSRERWQAKYGHLPSSNNLVILIFAAFLFVALIGILAAVALPAYSDYTARARAAVGLEEAQPYVREVERYMIENDVLPSNGVDYREKSDSVENIVGLEEGAVEITFKPLTFNRERYTIIYRPELEVHDRDITNVVWYCYEGTMPDRLRPPACRQSL